MQFELRVPELPLAAVVAAVRQMQQVPRDHGVGVAGGVVPVALAVQAAPVSGHILAAER